MPSFYCITVPGNPLPKARPRMGGRRVYTPKRTVDAERQVAEALSVVSKFDSNVSVKCTFYRDSKRRVDLDNLVKTVLDAATAAGVWHDDSQVTVLSAALELDKVNPRTEISIGPHLYCTMPRGKVTR